MKNINFKKLIWKVFLTFWNIFALVGLCVTAYFLYIVFDEEGYCLSSQHGVWDADAKICRTDCMKWDKIRGCIKDDNANESEPAEPQE
jgi:hypothetical protein